MTMEFSPTAVERWLQLRQRIVELVDSGQTAAVESLLVEYPEISSEETLLIDCICVEFRERVQRGQTPHRDEYRRRFPDQALPLRALFEVFDPLDPPNIAERMVVPVRPLPEAAMSTIIYSHPKATKDTSHVENSEIGDYEILSEIARGGMGVVYKARHKTLGRLAAVKLIKSGELADAEQIRRFHDEAKAAAQLDHPAIVPVFEAGEHQGQHFMALAFVDGVSLWSRVKDSPLEPKDAARIMQQVSEAMQYAHDRGIIHRDLKPQNVLLSKEGLPRVTDFGLAKHQSADSSLTIAGHIMGTPSYMPPEQARGDWEHVGPLSDVYSLGATLYCLLTGRPPFQAANFRITCEQVIHAEPVSPRVLNPAVDKDLETICLKCLQKDADRRYASARILAADLGRFLRDEPILARPVGKLERFRRWCRRNPAVATLTCIVVLALSWTSLVLTRMLIAERLRVEAQEKRYVAEMAEQDARLQAATADAAKIQAEAEKKQALVAEESAKTVSTFYSGLFLDFDPLKLGQGVAGDEPVAVTTTADEIIKRGANRILKYAEDTPLLKATLMDNIGYVCRSRSQYDAAEPLLKQALEIRERLLPPDDLDLATSHFNYGWCLQDIGEFEQGRKHLQQALEIRTRYTPQDERKPDHELLLAATKTQIAWLLADQGDRELAERMFREVYDVRLRILGPKHRETLLAQTYLLAVLLAGDHEKEALMNSLKGQDSVQLASAVAKYYLATTFREARQYEASAKAYRELIETARDHFGKIDHPVVAMLYGDLAGMFLEQGDLVHAQKTMETAIQIGTRSLHRHPKMPPVLHRYAEELERLGRYDESERWFREALSIAEVHNIKSYNPRFQLYVGLARVLGSSGRLTESIATFQAAVDRFRSQLPPHDIPVALSELAAFYENNSQFADAEKLRREIVLLVDMQNVGLDSVIVRTKLAAVLRNQGNLTASGQVTEEALVKIRDYFQQHAAPGGPLNQLLELADFLEDFGEPGELSTLARKCLPADFELYAREDHRALVAVSRGAAWSFLDHYGQLVRATPAADGRIAIPEWQLTGRVRDVTLDWGNQRWTPLGRFLSTKSPNQRGGVEEDALKAAAVLARCGAGESALKIFGDIKAARKKQKYSAPILTELSLDEARTYFRMGQFEPAIERYQAALEVHRQFSGDDHPIIGKLLLSLAEACLRAGRTADAVSFAREAVANRQTHFGKDHPLVLQALQQAGEILLTTDESATQITGNEWIAEAVSIAQKLYPVSHSAWHALRLARGRGLIQVGEAPRAENWLKVELDRLREIEPEKSHRLAELKLLLGESVLAQARYNEAEMPLLQGHTALAAAFPAHHTNVRQARRLLVKLYEAWGQPDRAVPWSD